MVMITVLPPTSQQLLDTDFSVAACRQTPLAELADTCAFSCGCEKGAWLALRRLLEPDGASAEAAAAGPGGPAGLWAELEPLFAYVLNPPPPTEGAIVDEVSGNGVEGGGGHLGSERCRWLYNGIMRSVIIFCYAYKLLSCLF